MADLATLGLTVDASQGVQELRRFSSELDRTGKAGDNATRITKAQEAELRRLAEISRSMGDIQGTQFRTLIQLNGGNERFLQIQKQIDQELLQADQVAKQYTATTNTLSVAKDRSTLAANRMRSGMSTLAAQIAGVSPVAGQLAGVMASFAVGSVLTVGILAGVAAISAVYGKLTEDTRNLKEETKKAIEELRRLRLEQQGATAPVSGLLDKAVVERDRLQADLERKRESFARSGNQNRFARPFAEEEDRLKELNSFIEAAERERNRIISDGSKQTQQTFVADLANLVRHNRATAQERANALSLLRAFQANLNRLPPTDIAGRSALVGQIETLNDALFPKKTVDAAEKRIKEMLERITKLAGNIDLSAVTANITARISTIQIPTTIDKLNGPARTEEQKEFDKQQEARSRADTEWRRAESQRLLATKDATKSLTGLEKSAFVAGNALESLLVQRIGGGGLGASVGSAVARGGLADATKPGTFAASATGQALLGGIAGAVGAAIGTGFSAFAKDIFNLGGSARQAAEALKRLKQFENDVAKQRATVVGDSLTGAILDVQAEYDRLRELAKQQHAEILERLSSEKDAKAIRKAREDALAELNRLELQRIEILKQEDAERKRFAKEDLEVRALRASGRDKEADTLALLNQQRQELFEAEKAGYDAAYIARLKEVQAMERAAAELNKLSTEVRNAPRGFKVESYINRFATPLSPAPYSPPPMNIPFTPTAPDQLPSKTVNVFQIGEGAILIDGNESDDELARKMARGLRKIASTTLGLNVKLSEVMDYVN